MSYSISNTVVIAANGTIDYSKIFNLPAFKTGVANTVVTGNVLVASGNVGHNLTIDGNNTHYWLNYRNYYVNCVCDCAICGTCLMAGSKILLTDGTQKNIEEIQKGDKVATLYGDGLVTNTRITRLGSTRFIMSIGDLYLSNDHRIWVRKGNYEGWGTYNLNHYKNVVKPDLKYEIDDPIELDGACEIAGVYGWTNVTPLMQFHYGPDTDIYQLEVDHGSYFANGFAVVAQCPSKPKEVKWGAQCLTR